MDRKTDRLISVFTDRITDGQTKGQTDRQTDGKTVRQTYGQTDDMAITTKIPFDHLKLDCKFKRRKKTFIVSFIIF